METRKITVIESANNRKVVINSSAKTVGELKNDLERVSINTNGMVLYEGLTHAEFNADDNAAILPQNVQRIVNGQPETTNELVFMITAAQKNIKSGAVSRAEVYAIIKENNLQQKVKDTFGRNYTQVPTGDLLELIERVEETEEETPDTSASEEDDKKKDAVNKDLKQLKKILHFVINIITDVCDDEDDEDTDSQEEDNKCPYSDSELEDMFSHLQ